MSQNSAETLNIDAAEIDKFEQLASRWWDTGGEFKPLHDMNPVRLNFINRGSPLDGMEVCDIGCGGGILSEAMARLGATVAGIDVVERNIHVAALHAGQAGLAIDYRHTTAEALAEAGERFDAVLNMEVVEHVADLDGFMAACGALVADGGVAFLSDGGSLFWLH